MKVVKLISAIYLITLMFSSCNLEKEIFLELPLYEPQPVVECYLEPGQPFVLLLTRSASYFAPFPTDLVNFLENIREVGAEVVISHNGKTYSLTEGIFINPTSGKVFNYGSSDLVPFDFENPFDLNITLKDGKTITASAKMLVPVNIDSVVVEYRGDLPSDTLARNLVYFNDPDISQENYFRRQLHQNSLVDSLPLQDFIATDRFADNGLIAFGSGYAFPEGTILYNTVYHVSKDYFEYLKSVFSASASNGNPFGQPSTITGNVKGDANAIGIFTTLNYVRDTVLVRK